MSAPPSDRLIEAVATFQIESCWSFPAVTRLRPSGENAAPRISNWVEAVAPCWIDATREAPVSMFRNTTCVWAWALPSPLLPTIAAVRPFGLVATAFPPNEKRLMGVRAALHTVVSFPGPEGLVVTSAPSGANAIAKDDRGAT